MNEQEQWEEKVKAEWSEYDNGVFRSLHSTIDFIHSLITSRDTYWKEEMKKARQDWLRSEIEKLEGMKQPITIDDRVESAFASIEWDRYNEALTTIITRYKEELKELESKI